MKATLIFNPNSGLVNLVTPRHLEEALRAAGYAVDYRPTSCEEDLDEALENVEGLVVAAGGDGTVRAVALRLIDRDVKLAILPMGRANNIARTLGIQGNPLDVVDGLRDPRHRRFDVGRVCCPWGKEYFLETFGLGFFADTVAHLEPGEERSLPRVTAALAETLAEYESRPIRMTVDGQDLSGDYTVVEDPKTAPETVRHWLADDGALLAERAENARQLGHPRAAFEVAEIAWNAEVATRAESDPSWLIKLFEENEVPWR